MRLPTIDDVYKEQDDLRTLCADRELDTAEIFVGNAFYGNSYILKAYAGIPQKYPLKFIIPHGIVFSDSFIWNAESSSCLQTLVCFQKNRTHVYKTKLSNKKKIVDGASPYVYVSELLGVDNNIKKEGTIFFPAHSTHHITVQTDFETLADTLASLDKVFQPVTVCLYWRDYNLGYHKFFEKRGLRIVSAGHIYDPMFLFRFFHLCSHHKFSGCNKLGSHLFYAHYSGCKHFIIDSGAVSYSANQNILNRDSTVNCSTWDDEVSDLFSSTDNDEKKKRDKIVGEYLGVEAKKSRSEMKKFFLKSEIDHLAFKAQKRLFNPSVGKFFK